MYCSSTAASRSTSSTTSRGERLVFSIYLDTLPGSPAEPLLRELLHANLYWIGGGGATLCLESETNAILLLYASRVAELHDARFERIVENLLATAEKWRERIAAHRTGAVGRDAKPAERPPISPEASAIYG